MTFEPCEDCVSRKIDEFEVKGKTAEVRIVKGKLQIRCLGVIHNIPLSLVTPQPCEDCISRQAVLSYISNVLGFGDEENGYDLERKIAQEEIYNFVKKIRPSVTPKEKSDHDHDVMKDYVDGEAFILGMLRKEIELIPVNCKESEFIIKRMLETIDRYEEGFVLPFARK